MHNPMEADRLTLLKLIVEQIIEDADKGDYTAVEELLSHVPIDTQLDFLNDQRQDQYALATSLS